MDLWELLLEATKLVKGLQTLLSCYALDIKLWFHSIVYLLNSAIYSLKTFYSINYKIQIRLLWPNKIYIKTGLKSRLTNNLKGVNYKKTKSSVTKFPDSVEFSLESEDDIADSILWIRSHSFASFSMSFELPSSIVNMG